MGSREAVWSYPSCAMRMMNQILLGAQKMKAKRSLSACSPAIH